MAEPKITEATVTLAGVPEGEVLPTGEKIVHDLDEKGNVIGWHKEVVSNG